MRKALNPIMLFFGAILIVTGYTNCDNYSQNDLYSSQSKQVILNNCYQNSGSCNLDEQVQYIELRISNTDPTYLALNEPSIKLQGECYLSVFKEHKIHYKLGNASNPELASGVVMDAEGNASQCTNGIFNIFVPLPFGYQYNVRHTIEIELVGYLNGKPKYYNPALAKQSVDVVLDPSTVH